MTASERPAPSKAPARAAADPGTAALQDRRIEFERALRRATAAAVPEQAACRFGKPAVQRPAAGVPVRRAPTRDAVAPRPEPEPGDAAQAPQASASQCAEAARTSEPPDNPAAASAAISHAPPPASLQAAGMAAERCTRVEGLALGRPCDVFAGDDEAAQTQETPAATPAPWLPGAASLAAQTPLGDAACASPLHAAAVPQAALPMNLAAPAVDASHPADGAWQMQLTDKRSPIRSVDVQQLPGGGLQVVVNPRAGADAGVLDGALRRLRHRMADRGVGVAGPRRGAGSEADEGDELSVPVRRPGKDASSE